MGFFRDIHRVGQQAKEAGRGAADAPAERLAALNRRLAQANAALTAPPSDSVDASARIVAVRGATGMLNSDPIVPVELLILEVGAPPRPLSTSVIVPVTQLARIHAGSTVPVKLSTSNPEVVAVDWEAIA